MPLLPWYSQWFFSLYFFFLVILLQVFGFFCYKGLWINIHSPVIFSNSCLNLELFNFCWFCIRIMSSISVCL